MAATHSDYCLLHTNCNFCLVRCARASECAPLHHCASGGSRPGEAGGEARRSVPEYTLRRPVEARESRTSAVKCRSTPRRSLWGTPLRTTSALSSLFTPTCARQSLCWLEYREDPSTRSVLQPLQPNTTHSLAQTHNRTFMRTRTLYARPPALCPRAHTRTHASTQPKRARAQTRAGGRHVGAVPARARPAVQECTAPPREEVPWYDDPAGGQGWDR